MAHHDYGLSCAISSQGYDLHDSRHDLHTLSIGRQCSSRFNMRDGAQIISKDPGVKGYRIDLEDALRSNHRGAA